VRRSSPRRPRYSIIPPGPPPRKHGSPCPALTNGSWPASGCAGFGGVVRRDFELKRWSDPAGGCPAAAVRHTAGALDELLLGCESTEGIELPVGIRSASFLEGDDAIEPKLPEEPKHVAIEIEGIQQQADGQPLGKCFLSSGTRRQEASSSRSPHSVRPVGSRRTLSL